MGLAEKGSELKQTNAQYVVIIIISGANEILKCVNCKEKRFQLTPVLCED